MAEGWRGWPGHLAAGSHFLTIEAALRYWQSAMPHRPPGKPTYELDLIGKLGRNESLLQRLGAAGRCLKVNGSARRNQPFTRLYAG
jgi:hypothetical protein